jgi:hypothetical protein
LFENTGHSAEFGHTQRREGLIKCLRIYENNGTMLILAKDEHWKRSRETTTRDLRAMDNAHLYGLFRQAKEPQK